MLYHSLARSLLAGTYSLPTSHWLVTDATFITRPLTALSNQKKVSGMLRSLQAQDASLSATLKNNGNQCLSSDISMYRPEPGHRRIRIRVQDTCFTLRSLFCRVIKHFSTPRPPNYMKKQTSKKKSKQSKNFSILYSFPILEDFFPNFILRKNTEITSNYYSHLLYFIAISFQVAYYIK